MVHALMALGAGLFMLRWRPCQPRGGGAPRLAIALLLLSATAVWAGSLGVAVAVAAGEVGDVWIACGVLWRQLLSGQLEWWRLAPLLGWSIAFPLRAIVLTRKRLRSAHRLRRGLTVVAQPLASPQLAGGSTSIVPGLTTPAITLGLLTPAVYIDQGFWAGASPLERDVVLAHELAHAAGRHALVDALAAALTGPIAPATFARAAYDCVRRHLEALADDVAARRHGADVVGRAVGRIALGASPPSGLGAAGACVWRVRRLVVPPSASAWRERVLLLSMVLMMAVNVVLALTDTASALEHAPAADFCPVPDDYGVH